MNTRLFIGNLSFEATEKQLRDLFEQAGGTVRSLQLVTDRDTGRPRGFAFAEMESEEQAKAAIAKLNGKDLLGRPLDVKEAEQRAGRSGGGDQPGFRSRSGHEDRGAKGGFGLRGPQQMPRGSTRGGGRGGSRGS